MGSKYFFTGWSGIHISLSTTFHSLCHLDPLLYMATL
jgi:hypothetical protein